MEFNNFCHQNSSEDLCQFFCLYPSSMVRSMYCISYFLIQNTVKMYKYLTEICSYTAHSWIFTMNLLRRISYFRLAITYKDTNLRIHVTKYGLGFGSDFYFYFDWSGSQNLKLNLNWFHWSSMRQPKLKIFLTFNFQNIYQIKLSWTWSDHWFGSGKNL